MLQALDMRALLDPVNAMLTQALSFVPNIVAAVVVGGVGWLVAKVLQQLVMQLLSSMGSDDWASQAGLSSSLKLSHLAGIVAFLAVFIPSLIAALDALRIESISGPATNMLNMVVAQRRSGVDKNGLYCHIASKTLASVVRHVAYVMATVSSHSNMDIGTHHPVPLR